MNENYMNLMRFSWLRCCKCLISVSDLSFTFLTATKRSFNWPLNTAPCDPEPSHSKWVIVSNGISQLSSEYAIVDLVIPFDLKK